MDLNPSSEVASLSSSQEFPQILWSPKAHCPVHNCLPLIPILSQMNPVHTTQFYFSNIHFSIILTHTFRPSSWSPSHYDPVRIPLLSHACYMYCPSHLPSLEQSIWRGSAYLNLCKIRRGKRVSSPSGEHDGYAGIYTAYCGEPSPAETWRRPLTHDSGQLTSGGQGQLA